MQTAPLTGSHEDVVSSDEKNASVNLEKALTAVKEIRFNLNADDGIPRKQNVKSHTTTPTNTPFEISPPKTPEPEENPVLLEGLPELPVATACGENDLSIKERENAEESASIFSLSSSEGSADEFVVVPLPRCFDLNVPFQDEGNDKDFSPTDNEIFGLKGASSFEVIKPSSSDSEGERETERCIKEAEQFNILQNTAPNSYDCTDCILDPLEKLNIQDHTDIKYPVLDEKHENESLEKEQPTETEKPEEPITENTAGGQIPSSTNPFRQPGNENVIHILPESIATGALSAAAHIYNNVSRALFSTRQIEVI